MVLEIVFHLVKSFTEDGTDGDNVNISLVCHWDYRNTLLYLWRAK